MNIGMLWQLQGKTPIEKQLIEAISYYRNKYGCAPNTAFVNPKMLEGREVLVGGILVRPLRTVGLSLLWIGVEDATEGLERASQNLLDMAEAAL
jgi:hypothetical protein